MIEGSVPDLGLDGQVVLSIDGTAAKLKGVVARKDPDATLLTFDLGRRGKGRQDFRYRARGRMTPCGSAMNRKRHMDRPKTGRRALMHDW